MKQHYKKIWTRLAFVISLFISFCAQAQTSCTPSVTITATADTVCPGSSVTFIAAAVNGGTSPVYQWQLNGYDAGNSSDTFIAPSISNGSFISCILTSNASCDSGLTATSNSITITVISIPNISITASPNPVCAGDPVQLQTNTVPFCGVGLPTAWNTLSSVVGSGNIIQPGGGTAFPTILGNYARSYRQQMLYTATELYAVLGGPQAIGQISFNIPSYNSNAYLNITVHVGCSGLDSLTAWQDGLSEVAAIPNMQPHNGWNNLQLSSPFYWDGVSNLVIDVCIYDPQTYGSQNNKAQCTNTAFKSYIYESPSFYTDSVDLCGQDLTPVVSTLRPNIRFVYGPPVYSSYTYDWSPAHGAGAVSDSSISNPTAVPLQATTYYLTIADTFGCRYTDSVAVATSTGVPVPTITTNNDTLTSSATSGNQWYFNGQYIPGSAGQGQVIFANQNGNYAVTVTNGACSATSAVFFVGLKINASNYACANIGNGHATAIASGDSSYTYHWNTGATTATIDSLPPGTYTVTVTSNTGQTAAASDTINIDEFDYAVNIFQPNCGDSNTYYGSAMVSITIGSGTFYYHWSNGDSTSSVTNLAPGNYSITVSDTNSCTLSSNFQINTDTLLIVDLSSTGSTGNNGTAGAVVVQGAPPYHYYWSNGETTDTINSLQPGIYTITITDWQGCSYTASDTVQNLTGIINTQIPTPTINIFPNPTDGQLTVTLTGAGYISVKLLDELGQEVYTHTLNAEEQEQNLQLDISHVANGIYVLQVITPSGNLSKRVVVQK